jgi:hypothetical protein
VPFSFVPGGQFDLSGVFEKASEVPLLVYNFSAHG